MSGLIHFSSGKTLEITEYEFANMSPKLNSKGIKTQKTKSGHLIPLNSMTMEYIEHVPEDIICVLDIGDGEIGELPRTDAADPVLPEQDKQEEKPKVKTQEEMMAEMLEKSNCKHEPDKMVLYRQHTAKGIRYFPRCSFCGKRERYISESKIVKGEYKGTVNEKWTETDIADAIDWIED
jgi:hypothetical protein